VAEGIDATTPAGRFQLHVLAAIAEFERARIAQSIRAGLQRAKPQGRRLGRPHSSLPLERLQEVQRLTIREAARVLACRDLPLSGGYLSQQSPSAPV
jgi:DNA invertase Pin-like site-specific DNA recombinase